MSMTRTGVTMQTSAKRAKFPSVYEWLQVGRLERSQVRRGDLACGALAVWPAYIDLPVVSKLSALIVN